MMRVGGGIDKGGGRHRNLFLLPYQERIMKLIIIIHKRKHVKPRGSSNLISN